MKYLVSSASSASSASRAWRALALVLTLAAVSGCSKLLKKLKQKEIDTALSATPSATGDSELAVVNSGEVLRFPDEVPLHGAPAVIRQFTLARTMPNEGGVTVSAVSANALVQKFAERSGYTLVSFDRPGLGRHAGWISNVAFLPQQVASATTIAPTLPTGVPSATIKSALSDPHPVPTVTASGVKPAGAGQCSLQLRVSGFIGSDRSCSFNEKVRENSPSTITFPCAGGSTTAKFGTQVFTGSASSSKISLTQIETFPFGNCQYKSIQTITGAPPNLQYTYAETVLSGGCKASSTCTAKAVMTAL